MSTIGERVREMRARKGWNRVELAVQAGVSQTTISMIECGHLRRPQGLVSIAKALGVSAEWLETGKGVQQRALRKRDFPVSEEEKALFRENPLAAMHRSIAILGIRYPDLRETLKGLQEKLANRTKGVE